uniref:ATP-dependent Clp protease proteolytic subunit n=1 Tax=Stephanosphaera pluvialis TaxID=51712 RepID=A0A0S2IDF5_9CHLO|nr:proteolytic subunit 2 of clp protease [Stephanosphaera pluvialis]
MPIGVPRIIYCWGEELPAQWTDIYNFIFRRRMVFLMQYLDDELCNQICGLLINIHMEDRSKELEKKEMETPSSKAKGTAEGRRNTKSAPSSRNLPGGTGEGTSSGSSAKRFDGQGRDRQTGSTSGKPTVSNEAQPFFNKKSRSMEDLLNADEDLGIYETYTLEQYTLQKITTEWLNWNAQFFDYSDEHYLFYLAELLSKDFNKGGITSPFSFSPINSEKNKGGAQINGKVYNAIIHLLNLLKNNKSYASSLSASRKSMWSISKNAAPAFVSGNNKQRTEWMPLTTGPSYVYSPFRTYAHFSAGNYSLKDVYSFPLIDDFLFLRFTKNTQVSFMKQPYAWVMTGNKEEQRAISIKQSSSTLSTLPSSAGAEHKKTRGAAKVAAINILLAKLLPTTPSLSQGASLPSMVKAKAAKGAYVRRSGSPFDVVKGKTAAPSEKTLGQRNLRREYSLDFNFWKLTTSPLLAKGVQMGQPTTSFLKGTKSKLESFYRSDYGTRGIKDLTEGQFRSQKQQGLDGRPFNGLFTPPAKAGGEGLDGRPRPSRGPLVSANGKNWPSNPQPSRGSSSEQKETKATFLGKGASIPFVRLSDGGNIQGIKGDSSSSWGQRDQVETARKSLSCTAANRRIRYTPPVGGGVSVYSHPCVSRSAVLSPSSMSGGGHRAPGGGSTAQQLRSQGVYNNTILNVGIRDKTYPTGEFRDYYRKQTERALIEEESKKVFVIINSFGGSVGNGITVHDALQFIKAGSLTLGLGVAASAASLVLAGGTIGERYVTEGCHVMLHQPESASQGQASDIWIDSQEIMKIRLDVAEIYSLATYRPRHKILRDLDRDFYLTATETIQYGLADEIATNEVMESILEETNKAWDYDNVKQQRLLESRESASSGLDTQTQN